MLPVGEARQLVGMGILSVAAATVCIALTAASKAAAQPAGHRPAASLSADVTAALLPPAGISASAQLADERGAAATASEPTVLQANTLTQFGYYYGLSPRNQLEGFANHSTTTFVLNGGQNMTKLALTDIADLKLLRAKNMTAILASVQFVFGSQAKLSSNYSAQWEVYWRLLEPHSSRCEKNGGPIL